MHHCQTKKKSKNFMAREHIPLSRPILHWVGGYRPDPDPRPTSPRRLRRLHSRAFGARRSRSFTFTTRTLLTCQSAYWRTMDWQLGLGSVYHTQVALLSQKGRAMLRSFNTSTASSASNLTLRTLFCSPVFVVVVHAAGCDKYRFTDASP